MWKLVRNMLLLTVALAVALQLLLWVAAQQQAGAIAAQLAPWRRGRRFVSIRSTACYSSRFPVGSAALTSFTLQR